MNQSWLRLSLALLLALVIATPMVWAAEKQKPPPARQLERLPGGWGIVLDDIAAGIMGNLVLHAAWAL